MTDKENRKKNFRLITDTILAATTSRIYDKRNKHYGKTIWILQCRENTIKVLEDILEDKDFLNTLESGGVVLNKEFNFVVFQRGSYLVKIGKVDSEVNKV